MPREGYKECPFCAEEILEKAIKCRYCHSMLIEVPGAIAGKPPEVPSTEEERRLERVIKYLPPKVAEIIQKDVEITDEGERKKITVLFADLTGFTTVSEDMDPEDVKLLMDDVFHLMVDAIERYNGTIDKYMGDAVMALFGAPQAHEDDPELAIRAASEMRDTVRRLGRERNLKLDLSFGISTGEVVVGGLGTEQHLEYTAIGDRVNIAFRLEQVAAPGEILVDENTWRAIRDVFECVSLGPLSLKGKKHLASAYRVTRIGPETAHEARLRRRELTPLVGREAHLARLKSWIEDSFAREGVFIRLSGEAGVGKSRLLLELRKRVNPLRKSWLVAQCVSYGEHIPYHPIIHALKELCDVSPEDDNPSVEEKIRRALPDDIPESPVKRQILAHLFGLPLDRASVILAFPPQERQELIHRHLLELFRTLAEKQTLILTFEDLHWADEATLRFIDFALPRMKATPVAVIFVYRPHWRREWVRDVTYHDMELDELSNLQSEILLDRILNIPTLDPQVRKQVLEKAAGNPFYVEEILRAMRDHGVLRRKDDTWEVAGDLAAVPIPDTLHGLILARLDLLEIKVKRVLQCASVIGQRFRYSILEYLTRVRKDLKHYLTQLAGVELIYEESALPELEYLFRHLLVQDVTYRTLLLRRRREYHGRVALCLEELYQHRLDEHHELLAHHYYFSNLTEKAIGYCWKAGEKSRLLFANEAAVDFYTRRLELLDKKEESRPTLRERIETLVARGRVRQLIGETAAAGEDFGRAEEVATRLNDAVWLGETVLARADLARFTGDLETASRLFEQALTSFRSLRRMEGLNQARRGLAAVHWNQGNYPAARDLLAEMLDGPGAPTALWDLADTWNTLGLVQWNLGEYPAAVASLEKAVEYRVELEDRKGLAIGLINLGIVEERLGRFPRSAECYLRALEHSKQIGYLQGEVAARVNLGQLYVIQGILPSAQDHYQKALELARATGDSHAEAMVLGNIGQAWCAESRLDEAEKWLREAHQRSEQLGDHDAAMNAERGLAELELARGRPQAARDRLESAIRVASAHGHGDVLIPFRRLLARAGRESGAHDAARRDAEAALDEARKVHHRAEELWALQELARIKETAGENPVDELRAAAAIAGELRIPAAPTRSGGGSGTG